MKKEVVFILISLFLIVANSCEKNVSVQECENYDEIDGEKECLDDCENYKTVNGEKVCADEEIRLKDCENIVYFEVKGECRNEI